MKWEYPRDCVIAWRTSEWDYCIGAFTKEILDLMLDTSFWIAYQEGLTPERVEEILEKSKPILKRTNGGEGLSIDEKFSLFQELLN